VLERVLLANHTEVLHEKQETDEAVSFVCVMFQNETCKILLLVDGRPIELFLKRLWIHDLSKHLQDWPPVHCLSDVDRDEFCFGSQLLKTVNDSRQE